MSSPVQRLGLKRLGSSCRCSLLSASFGSGLIETEAELLLDVPPHYYGLKMTGVALLLLALGFLGLTWRRRRRLARLPLWPAHATLCGFVLACFCLVLELLFALIYDQTDAVSATNVSRRWFRRHVRMNNAGVRDPQVFTPVAPHGTLRIALVGDSITFGHGVRDAEARFGDQLRRRLDRDAPGRFQVYNVASCGADSPDHLVLLRYFRLAGFRFHRVLLVYSLNDACSVLQDNAEQTRALHDLTPRTWLFRDTYLLNFLYYRFVLLGLPQSRDYGAWLARAYAEPCWTGQRLQLEQFADECRAHGMELAVVTFPLVQYLGADYPLRNAHVRLASLWRDLAVPHLDLLPFLERHAPSELTVNRFDGHPNELAHRIAADAIYEHLLIEDPLVRSSMLNDTSRSLPSDLGAR